MNFEVDWLPDAEEELAGIWLNSSDRSDVRDAAQKIDDLLSHNATAKGESRDKNRRILFVPPLACEFVAQDRIRLALVVRVWRLPRRST